jgi:hypothetical protein
MHMMELLGDLGHVESHFGPFEIVLILMQDRPVCAECIIGSEIILDAPNGIPGDEAHVEAHFGLF